MLQTELETRTKELRENAELLNQQVSEEHSVVAWHFFWNSVLLIVKICIPQSNEGVSSLFLLTSLDFLMLWHLMFSNQRTRRLHVTVLQCYNSVAKLDLPFKKTQPQLLVRGCNCWEAALNVKDSHSYSWLQYLMPNVCTIECYAFKLDTKYMFCLCSGLSTHSYSYSITQLSWWTRRIELSLPSFFFGQVVFSSKINLAPFFNLIFFSCPAAVLHSSAFPRVSDFVSNVAWHMMNDLMCGLWTVPCADMPSEQWCCLSGCWRRRSRCQSCRVSWPRWETPWSFTGKRTM